ncbi:O-linked N-acetylglucosamine transferase family protein [Asticcacaulis solisilvae]|uniref:O-linked N-acetylglucosamine transferase family protein n=1 Tax=Asticcacaulis solisilvae TaxID=1217274 RepID=UPI003FD790EC
MNLSPQQQAIFREAVMLHQGGRLEPARNLYHQILQAAPNNADLLRFAGTVECQLGNLSDGAGLLARSLDMAPNQPEVHHNLGHALLQLGRIEEAVRRYEGAVALRPDYVSAWSSLGAALMTLDRSDEALACFDRVLAMQPDNREALSHRGGLLILAERFADAVASYDRLLRLAPGQAAAWSNRGIALTKTGRYAEALVSYDRALELEPDLADAWSNRGDALGGLGRDEDAIASCDRALSLRPDFAKTWNIRGNAELNLRRPEDALASYDRALALMPGHAETMSSRAGALLNLKRYADALESSEAALALKPDLVEARKNRGAALLGLERFDEALAEFARVLKVRPDWAEVHNNCGNAMQGLKRLDEAAAFYDNALRFDPDNAEVHNNHAGILVQFDLTERALAGYRRVVALQPDFPWAAGQVLHNQMHLSDWTGYREQLEHISARLRRGEKSVVPFGLQAMVDDPALHRLSAAAFAGELYPGRNTLPPFAAPPEHDRLRIGYVSSDFGEHPVTYLLAGMLERHDRTKFEIFAISLGKGTGPWRERVVAGVEHFIDVSDLNDADIVTRMRELEIDIAVDLNGYTQACRTAVFAERVAPVQLHYIGFLGTMGVSFIDYIIADDILIPRDLYDVYAEKVVSLPSFQMNDDRTSPQARSFTRAELGLPDDGFVFCCFNQNFKITPDVFDSWMRILDRVPGSVLWLHVKAPVAMQNLIAEAERRGIAPGRLVFAPRVPLEDHLARQTMAGLFLDTHPYNAGATASNALRVGLPVLTMIGQSYAGRMGASLLHAAGIPDLITDTPEQYEDLAVELATQPDRLAAIRRKLTDGMATCPLFDTGRSTRHMEAAFIAMHDRVRKGLQPDHITVSDT